MKTTKAQAFSAARTLMRLRRNKEAADYLGSALTSLPECAELHSLRSVCLLRSGRREEALDEALAGVALGVSIPFCHIAHSTVCIALENWDAAEKSSREAVRLDPGAVQSWGMLACILILAGRIHDGVEAARKGLAIDAGNAICMTILGLGLMLESKLTEAGAVSQQSLTLDPEKSLPHEVRGMVLMHLGFPSKACEHFGEALRLDPTSTTIADLMGEAQQQQQQQQLAAERPAAETAGENGDT